MKYPFPSERPATDDTLDGQFRLDPERMRAFEEAESSFAPLDGEAAERAGHSSRRALQRAFEDAGFSGYDDDDAVLPARARWLDRVIRMFQAPGFLAGCAAVALAIFVTSRFARDTSEGDLLAFSGAELEKRALFRCDDGTVVRVQATPRSTTRWCEHDGKKHGWSVTLTICGEVATPGCGEVRVECYREGALVEAAACRL